jgi:hypothetical protein
MVQGNGARLAGFFLVAENGQAHFLHVLDGGGGGARRRRESFRVSQVRLLLLPVVRGLRFRALGRSSGHRADLIECG